MKSYYTKPVAVQAAEITGVSDIGRGYVLALENTPSLEASNAQCGNHIPSPGDFLIFGENDDTYLCPREVFLKKYHVGGGPMNFGLAVEAMKKGLRVARSGWNGKGMFAYFVPAASYPAQTGVAKQHFGESAMVPYNAYMALKGADGSVSTWAPSGSDALAEDWEIL